MHCWQAKFFDCLEHSQIKQLKESFAAALDKHPRMASYTISMPFNRNDLRRSKKASSQMDRWNSFSGWCDASAAKIGRKVVVNFWGSYEIFLRLTEKRHAGRRAFWFESPELDDDCLQKCFEGAIMIADQRYTPDAHVPLTITSYLDAAAHSKVFTESVHAALRRLLKQIEALNRYRDGMLGELVDGLFESGRTLEHLLPARQPWLGRIDVKSISELLGTIQKDLGDAYKQVGELQVAAKERRDENRASRSVGSEPDPHNEIRQHLHSTWGALELLSEVITGDRADLANGRPLLITGAAGSGKTHLLMDACAVRLKAGALTIVIHGQRISSDIPLHKYLCQELGVADSTEPAKILGLLGAFAEARNSIFLIFVDALNESQVWDTVWMNQLPSLLTQLEAYEHVRLVVSVRSDFLEGLMPEALRSQFVRVEHRGFEGAEYDAIKAYFGLYGIELTSPPLSPEFQNPLFLKLYCQSLQLSGQHRMPVGSEGFTKTLDQILDALNKRISLKLGLDPHRRSVHAAVSSLAGSMAASVDERSVRSLSDTAARRLVEQIHQGTNDYKGLYLNLIHEGVLTRYPVSRALGGEKHGKGTELHVRFAYERFTDHLIAQELVRHNPVMHESGDVVCRRLSYLLENPRFISRNPSLLEALSVCFPECHPGRELLDLIPSTHEYWGRLCDVFLVALSGAMQNHGPQQHGAYGRNSRPGSWTRTSTN